MQIRASSFQGAKPPCPLDPTHRVHAHGSYQRFADFATAATLMVFRFLCARCGFTLSVLPANRLPYRRLTTPQIETDFDARAADLPPPAATELETAALTRAWQALARHRALLSNLLGQLLPAALTTPAALWQHLRRWGSLADILHRLATPFHTSLCGHYRCLQPPTAVVS